MTNAAQTPLGLTLCCLLCDAPMAERHHLAGRLGGDYVDPDLTAPLCRACHRAEHNRWRARDLDSPERFTARRAEAGGSYWLPDAPALVVARCSVLADSASRSPHLTGPPAAFAAALAATTGRLAYRKGQP